MIIKTDSIIAALIAIITAIFGAFSGGAELSPIEKAPIEDKPAIEADVYVSGKDVLCFKTHDYFGGNIGGEAYLIKSESELSDFYSAYGEKQELAAFVKDVDFSVTALAYDMIEISSGSISCDLKGAYVSGGRVKFDYTMNYPEVGTCDMAMIYLFAKIPVSALNGEHIEKAGDIDIIPFPRRVTIGGKEHDNLSDTLVYEEKNARSWSGENYRPGSKAVFLSTDIIKRWYDPKMSVKNGAYSFKIGHLDVTLTKDKIIAENEFFGEVYGRSGINCIVREKDMLVAIGYLMELLSCGYWSEERLEPADDFMVKSSIDLRPSSTGSVNVGELNVPEFNFYTAGTVKEKPDGKIIAVNMRGNYIYKTAKEKYYLEAGDKYYVIIREMAGCFPE